jgi:hypothetical protein
LTGSVLLFLGAEVIFEDWSPFLSISWLLGLGSKELERE